MEILQILLWLHLASITLVSGKAIQGLQRTIKTNKFDSGYGMTENEIFSSINSTNTLSDRADFQNELKLQESIVDAIPTGLRFHETVQHVAETAWLIIVYIVAFQLSSHQNRYYASPSGRESQLELLERIHDALLDYEGDVIVSEVDHGYLQKSIIVRIIGSDPILRKEVVIIGSHIDSISFEGDVDTAPAPGADDNASGSAVVFETLRALTWSGVLLNRTIEFHWYAAAEVGLLGSQAIADQYRRDNVNVVAMLNVDSIGYHVEGVDEIAIYTDNYESNQELVEFTRLLTNGYLEYGQRNKTCRDGCSDNVSWSQHGYPSVTLGATHENPNKHTAQDIISDLDLYQIGQCLVFAIGFAVELGEPTTHYIPESANLLKTPYRQHIESLFQKHYLIST